VTNSRSVVLMVIVGLLGAILSGAALLLTALADETFEGYGSWIADELAVLAVVTVIGFVAGMLVALLWSVLLNLFAEDSTSA